MQVRCLTDFLPMKAVDLLETIGRWLHVNGEAIYATRYRSPYQDGDTNFFTKSKDGQYCAFDSYRLALPAIPSTNRLSQKKIVRYSVWELKIPVPGTWKRIHRLLNCRQNLTIKSRANMLSASKSKKVNFLIRKNQPCWIICQIKHSTEEN